MLDLSNLLDRVPGLLVPEDEPGLGLETEPKPNTGPSLYSKRAIFWLSFLCSVLLGFILLCINLAKQKCRMEFLFVISIFLVFVTVHLSVNFGWDSASALWYWSINLLGAFLMRWQYSIFSEGGRKYKTKKIGNVLLIVALLLFALRIFFTFRVERII